MYNPVMAETDWLESALRRRAPVLNRRSWRWPLVRPVYHVLADALYWPDEVPFWSRLGDGHDVLRCLWHYRTGLILGERWPFGEYWELGLRHFPRWVGFHPSRCSPSRRFEVIYRAGRRAAARCIRELEREMGDPD